ncbi:T6SS effector amidase Tae4 family protein [Acinetobacter higginsii]|uniref:T6SS effector amidase Tae4 family protein n=1 Tax=Acinetobacter higginsii TaxID=70347 RepID=UPI001F4B40A8|nr:T6SS effector amidase Tae4 family protein [Acinetobacter higginsii]MCH7296140.1 type VI secretion system amidase effector protein Tae4 [Acinetobacter higginsii]
MPVNQSGTVKTNPKRGSVAACSMVGIVPITFKELWDNYYGDKTPPYNINGQTPKGFENQCAIRMSVTLHKVGVKMATFSQNNTKPEGKAPTLGRIVLNNKATATRANEMAVWLQTRPVCGIGPAMVITGRDWQSKIKGKTGIIFFGEYWERDDESADAASGGHIDLWNKSKLTDNWTVFWRFTIGISSMSLGPYSYADYGKAKRILFFEVK